MVGITGKVATVQRAGTLAITGGLRTSPTDALDAATYLIPVPLLVDKVCHQAAIRLATLPKSHPLHRIANHKTSGKIKCHKSPMNSLLAAYRFDPKRVEKTLATARDPMLQGELPFITSIANSREDSIKEAESASEEVQVFKMDQP